MWVVFCDQTGNEMDSFEDTFEADLFISEMDEENEDLGYTYSRRWENR